MRNVLLIHLQTNHQRALVHWLHRFQDADARELALLSYSRNSRFTPGFQVPRLGKAMAKAGLTGSAALPSGVTSSKEGEPGAEFTVIGNQAALKLADSA
jgi:hypothetical protein